MVSYAYSSNHAIARVRITCDIITVNFGVTIDQTDIPVLHCTRLALLWQNFVIGTREECGIICCKCLKQRIGGLNETVLNVYLASKLKYLS